MDKIITTAYPIHDLLARRWSPRAFADRSVKHEELGSLLEAARCAPSCFNEQPWSFLVATREDEEGFERLASCLMDGNAWAKKAPVLLLVAARLAFERNDKPNRHALHDVGLAAQSLVIQAQALGLSTHQMAGFDAQRARDVLGIPEGYEPVSMLAVGYRDEPESLPDALREREIAPRVRKELDAIAFGATWGEPLAALNGEA
jgi:nitroreductase